jgi:hypothetical protein
LLSPEGEIGLSQDWDEFLGIRVLANWLIAQVGFPIDLEAGRVESPCLAGEFYCFNPLRSPISYAFVSEAGQANEGCLQLGTNAA